MWYTTGTGYKNVNGIVEPMYLVKYASSENGMDWRRKGEISVALQNDHEALGRPSVLMEDGIYKMWYSYRDIDNYRKDPTRSYRIGYAESLDGVHFARMDDRAGIDVSEDTEAWDGKMIAYGYVIRHKGKKYMFYNGNGFGQSGIGYAVWED